MDDTLCYRGDLYKTIKHPESVILDHCSYPRHVDGIGAVRWDRVHVNVNLACSIGGTMLWLHGEWVSRERTAVEKEGTPRRHEPRQSVSPRVSQQLESS